MSIKVKVTFTIIISLVIGGLAIIYLLNNAYKNNINLIAEESIKVAKETFNSIEKDDVKMLSATLEALLINKEITKAFLKKDRDKLYQTTAPLFKNLKERYGITHWYFINPEPEQTVFLRIHKSTHGGQYGDVVKRATYLRAVETKGFGTGKELGKTAFALRVVHPYYDNGKLIGYMELAQEIEHFFEIMKKQTGNDFGLLINKKYLDEKNWASVRANKGLRNNWADMKDVVLIDKTTEDEHIIEFNGDIAEIVPPKGMALEEIKKGASVYVRGVFPVYDVANRKVGGVFIIKDITPIYKGMKATQTKIIGSIVVLIIIISIAMLLMVNRFIFVRLDNMINIATRVVGGDYNTKIVPAADDEVGKFESLFEQFRTVFVNVLSELEKKKK